jgi:hypothetical protein
VNCTQCQIPMRKSQQRIADRPGTRVHAGSGLCYTCWRRARKAEEAATAAVPAARAALQAYLQRRGRVSA